MNKKIAYLSAAASFCLLLVLIVLTLGRLGFRGQPMPKVSEQHHSAATSPGAKETVLTKLHPVDPGWWEEERLIYFGIPTRIFFKLAPTQNTPEHAAQLAQKAWDEFDRVGAIFNSYHPDSFVSRLNAASKTSPQPVPLDFFKLTQISMQVFNASHGAFDPTVWPLKQLWSRAKKEQKLPSDQEIAQTVARVGLSKVHLNEAQKTLSFDRPDMAFDFGGIVKGYAVDQVREILKAAGATDGLVQNGGEIATFGKNDVQLWKIGVRHPKDRDGIWGTVTSAQPIRASTSGNYEQPIVIQGKEYYHVWDPRTGHPVSEKILGVTLVDLHEKVSNAFLDGATKAILVLGLQKGTDATAEMGLDYIVLTEENGKIRQTISPDLQSRFTPAGAGH